MTVQSSLWENRLASLPWIVLGMWSALHGCLRGPTVDQDSLFGLLAARDFHAGGAWNHLIFPDPLDLAQTKSAFLAWWPPAQWVIPDLFCRAGLPLGWALTLTTAVALFGGLLGFARLYQALGYDQTTSHLSLFLLVIGEYMWTKTTSYHGGEALLFGILPWIILGALRIGLRPAAIVLLPLLFLVGAFAKLSFSISALAIIVFLWLDGHASAPFSKNAFQAAVIGAFAFLLFHGAFSVGFLSRGITPNAIVGGTMWQELPFMPAGPLSFLIGGQHLSSRFLPELAGTSQLLWAATASGVSIALIVAAAKLAPTRRARWALLAFCATNVAAIAFLCWRGNRVWFIDRMFMPAGVLLLPAIVHLARSAPSAISRGAIAAVLAGASSYSLLYCSQRLRWEVAHTASGSANLRHFGLGQAGLQRLTQLLASPPAGATVFFSDPSFASLALELPEWRSHTPAYAALCGPSMIAGGPEQLRGVPAALVVIGAVDRSANNPTTALLRRFIDVPATRWQSVTIDRLLVCTTQP